MYQRDSVEASRGRRCATVSCVWSGHDKSRRMQLFIGCIRRYTTDRLMINYTFYNAANSSGNGMWDICTPNICPTDTCPLHCKSPSLTSIHPYPTNLTLNPNAN